ncbi:type III secretion system cytoplasmic ring protein SctQ, partial [Myxococcota bacterium]
NGRIQRPLTEIEAGVFSFIILKLLSHFHTGWQTGNEISLTLDRFAAKLEDIQDIIESEPSYHMVGVRVSAGRRSGYARIFIPDSFITQSFSTPPSQLATSEQELQHMRSVLKRIGEATVAGRIEVASLDLNPDDIDSLEVGDIILLENHQITKTSLGLEGNVFVKLGKGENGGLRGRLISDGDRFRLEILEIVLQEQPLEGAMVDEDGEDPEAEPVPTDTDESEDIPPESPESEDNLSETQGLLRDVDAPVVVELGRIRLNTTQVARLRTGQILRLPRGANDPVDLVVNGKLFARGELIEVDGELGVRLLQVAGAS